MEIYTLMFLEGIIEGYLEVYEKLQISRLPDDEIVENDDGLTFEYVATLWTKSGDSMFCGYGVTSTMAIIDLQDSINMRQALL